VYVPRAEAWLQPMVGSPASYLRFTRPLGGPGLALDDEAYADPRPGFGFSLTPKESTATSAEIIAAHAAAPGLFTTRCATHGLVALVIPLNCRDTFTRPPCCARTEEPYAGGAPPLGPGPRLSVDSAGRLAEGATSGAWRGCELNIAAIRATTTEHWDRAGVAYLEHGFPDGCATGAERWASNHYHPNHKSAEGEVAAVHVRKTTEDDVRAGRVVDFGVSCLSQADLDEWADGSGHRGAVVAPLGFILKADGVSGRTLTDASWTGGVDADYSVNRRQLLKPRFSMGSTAMMLACVRRLRAGSRPRAKIVMAKTDAAEAYRRLKLQRQGVERHLFTAGGRLYGNVAVPFGEAPSAAAYSRGALAFGAYLFARVQARAARGDLPQEVAAALARYEMVTVIDDTWFAVEECAAEYLHAEISHAHEVWGLTLAPKKLHEFVFRPIACFLGVTFDTERDVLYISAAKRAKWLPFLDEVASQRGPDGGAGKVTKAVWEKAVGILGHVAYVHPLCRRFLHHCYRTLAAVEGKASVEQVRVGAGAHSELATMIEFLRTSNELRGATPGLTRTQPRLPRRYISDASTTTGLCGMTLRAGVLSYWSYALTPDDFQLGLNINQLEAVAAAVTVRAWPPDADSHVDLCVDNQAVAHAFRRGASRRDEVVTRAFVDIGELLTSAGATWSTTWIPTAANALCDLGSRVADPRVLDSHLAQCFPRTELRRVTLAESPVALFARLR
jgi:hypothetical protein